MPEYSYWIIFGLILIIGEFVVSGLVLIFLGLAAVIVGGLAYFGLINDLTWEITLFAVLSLALLAGARRFLRDWLFGKETQGRTSEGEAEQVEGGRDCPHAWQHQVVDRARPWSRLTRCHDVEQEKQQIDTYHFKK